MFITVKGQTCPCSAEHRVEARLLQSVGEGLPRFLATNGDESPSRGVAAGRPARRHVLGKEGSFGGGNAGSTDSDACLAHGPCS